MTFRSAGASRFTRCWRTASLDVDRGIGLLLPYSVVVRAEVHWTAVEALGPRLLAEIAEGSALTIVAEEAFSRLSAALKALGG